MKSISVITPIFNGKKYLSSLLINISECYKYLSEEIEIEWIISNDDPDNPIDEMAMDNEEISVVILQTDINRGIQGARVRGLEAAGGEFILFLDQDDWISPRWALSQLEHIGDADAVVCDCTHDGSAFYRTNKRTSLIESITKEYNLKTKIGFLPGQVMIRKESIPDLWKRRWLKNNCCDDYYLWLCMFGIGCKFTCNPDVLYDHRSNGNNQTQDYYTWIESTHEMISILNEERVFNETEMNILIEAREKEIKTVLNDIRWLAIRHNLYRKMLECYEEESIDLSILECSKSIAIYGMDLGRHLFYILKNAKIKVDCMIDNYYKGFFCIPVFRGDCIPNGIDTVIITILKPENYSEVKNYIVSNYDNIKIINIDQVVS